MNLNDPSRKRMWRRRALYQKRPERFPDITVYDQDPRVGEYFARNIRKARQFMGYGVV